MVDLRITQTAATPVAPVRMDRAAAAPAGQGFGALLGRALDEVNALQLQAQDATVRLAAGQNVDMSKTLVAIERANISFQFTMQVRNKLLEAYQEMMRIQV